MRQEQLRWRAVNKQERTYTILRDRIHSGSIAPLARLNIDALARELGGRNIRVNSIAPGYLETEMTGKLDEEQRGQIIRRTPLGRLGTPEDVVGAVRFLMSPAASFITGQTLVIDGGITC